MFVCTHTDVSKPLIKKLGHPNRGQCVCVCITPAHIIYKACRERNTPTPPFPSKEVISHISQLSADTRVKG